MRIIHIKEFFDQILMNIKYVVNIMITSIAVHNNIYWYFLNFIFCKIFRYTAQTTAAHINTDIHAHTHIQTSIKVYYQNP